MKKPDFFAKLSELTKIDVEAMTTALTSDSDEVDIELPELFVFTKDEITTRDINSAKAGNKAAVEMAIRDARNEIIEQYGEEFKFEGKIMSNLIETLIKVGEKKAGVKPNDQLIEKDKIITKLQENIISLEAEKNKALQDKEKFAFNYEVDSTLAKKVPYIENATLTADEYISLWKRDKEIVKDNGIMTFKRNGEIVRDQKTQNPVSIEQDFEAFLTEKGAIQGTRNGRGEGDNVPRKVSGIESIKTSSDFEEYCDKNKITSLDGKSAALREVMKKNPEFTLA